VSEIKSDRFKGGAIAFDRDSILVESIANLQVATVNLQVALAAFELAIVKLQAALAAFEFASAELKFSGAKLGF
jgi:hypothetical protein